jgi:hypothetical protein
MWIHSTPCEKCGTGTIVLWYDFEGSTASPCENCGWAGQQSFSFKEHEELSKQFKLSASASGWPCKLCNGRVFTTYIYSANKSYVAQTECRDCGWDGRQTHAGHFISRLANTLLYGRSSAMWKNTPLKPVVLNESKESTCDAEMLSNPNIVLPKEGKQSSVEPIKITPKTRFNPKTKYALMLVLAFAIAIAYNTIYGDGRGQDILWMRHDFGYGLDEDPHEYRKIWSPFLALGIWVLGIYSFAKLKDQSK